MASGSTGRRDGKGGPSEAARARAALNDGDFSLAHSLAKAVLANADASESDKEEARALLDATRVDWPPIAVGLGVLTVLLVLFGWVLMHRNGS